MTGRDRSRNLFWCINAELATKIMFLCALVINTLITIISLHYCLICSSIFPSSWRSENPEFRIFFRHTGAQLPWNTRCSGVFSCKWRYMLCPSPSPWPPAHHHKMALCLFPDRVTLPENLEYARNRITRKPPSGNLVTDLYVCVLSGGWWLRQEKLIRWQSMMSLSVITLSDYLSANQKGV